MEKFWQNTLFVLTFANQVTLPTNQSNISSLREYFNKQISIWEDLLQQEALIKVGIDSGVAVNVPVVPAGYSDKPDLPGADYWLSRLWFRCLYRTAGDARPLLLEINWKQLRSSDEVKADMDDIWKKKGYQQPIIRDFDLKGQCVTCYLCGQYVLGPKKLVSL